MSWCALLDIGSTFTKGVAVELSSGRLLAAAQTPTTAAHDVRVGVGRVLGVLGEKAPGAPTESYASSSAQGGLGIVAVGLVPRFTLEAARQAALGAGGNVMRAFGYRLTPDDADWVQRARPDVVLLCGGIDGGDERVLLANAERLAARPRADGTVIVAGNRSVSPDAVELLTAAGWDARLLPNLLPEIDRLELEPVREAIRSVFLDKITRAKGIDAAEEMLDAVVMPTPAAVLRAAELVTGQAGPVGLVPSIVVVDVGGATTDIVSVCEISSEDDGVVQVGLPEPVTIRTVEGDLGVRYNARTIVERVGAERLLASSAVSATDLEEQLDRYEQAPESLPEEGAGALDGLLARAAVTEAGIRHAGHAELLPVPHEPPVLRVRGKDLRGVSHVVGTGGCLVRRNDGEDILGAIRFDPHVPESLRPVDPVPLVDCRYVLYACGLFADRHPDAALRLAADSLGLMERVR